MTLFFTYYQPDNFGNAFFIIRIYRFTGSPRPLNKPVLVNESHIIIGERSSYMMYQIAILITRLKFYFPRLINVHHDGQSFGVITIIFLYRQLYIMQSKIWLMNVFNFLNYYLV